MSDAKTILVVDDDVDILEQYAMLLKAEGYHVVQAGGLAEAEETILTVRPDLAILDLMMENEDSGFILCYKMKKKFPEVPIIISTAVAAETGITFDIHDENNRKWIKADCFLEKGVRSDVLKEQIEKLLVKS